MTFRPPTYKEATVFGGTGFIGRYVVQRMARRGWRVRVATRYPERALFLKPMGVVGQIAPIFANVRDDATVAAAIRGSDYVVNLAGILYESGRRTFGATHYEGAKRIADIAFRNDIGRLVHVSAIGADIHSESHYARSKAAGEKAVLNHYQDATILRPSVVFGPEDNFFNLFGMLGRLSPVLPVFSGTADTRFQPVYVGDVADAVMACLDRAETRGNIYELGGPKVYTYREILELTMEMICHKRWIVNYPMALARFHAWWFEMLHWPVLTRDQLLLLQQDSVVSDKALKLTDLGISPTAAELILPTYLDKYRPGGRFWGRRRVA